MTNLTNQLLTAEMSSAVDSAIADLTAQGLLGRVDYLQNSVNREASITARFIKWDTPAERREALIQVYNENVERFIEWAYEKAE